jgi:HEAT repeat protein
MREVADRSGGITDEEGAVAKALQSLSPESILPVMELLRDRDRNVREMAGYVLRNMPGLGPEHLAPLQRAVEEGDGWLPPAIASIGTPEAIRFLVDQLAKKPESNTQFTVALERLGPAAFPDLLELFRCGKSCDESLLRVVGSILAESRAKAAEVVTPLVAVATDPGNSLVARRGALRALGVLGPTARPAVTTLLEMTHGEPVELQADARQAVLGIGGAGTREALEASLDGAEAPQYVLRDIAALGEGGREAGPRVERLLSSREGDVRVVAARTLGLIGYRPAVSSLIAALDDPDDWRLVYVAAEALGRLRAAGARDALEATAFSHWYPPVRDAARNAVLALDSKYRYSTTDRSNFSLDFFDFEHAGRDYDPCADLAHFPAAPRRSDALDPVAQPALAQQLAYDREVVGWDEKGRHTSHHRTPAEVGLRIRGGWLVGADQGEWGGELVFRAGDGSTTMVLPTNIQGLHVLGSGRIVAVTGLAHLTSNDGILYQIDCPPSKPCTATPWKQLPGAPRSSWVLESGELLVNSFGGSVVAASDGRLAMAECHDHPLREAPLQRAPK